MSDVGDVTSVEEDGREVVEHYRCSSRHIGQSIIMSSVLVDRTALNPSTGVYRMAISPLPLSFLAACCLVMEAGNDDC